MKKNKIGDLYLYDKGNIRYSISKRYNKWYISRLDLRNGRFEPDYSFKGVFSKSFKEQMNMWKID